MRSASRTWLYPAGGEGAEGGLSVLRAEKGPSRFEKIPWDVPRRSLDVLGKVTTSLNINLA